MNSGFDILLGLSGRLLRIDDLLSSASLSDSSKCINSSVASCAKLLSFDSLALSLVEFLFLFGMKASLLFSVIFCSESTESGGEFIIGSSFGQDLLMMEVNSVNCSATSRSSHHWLAWMRISALDKVSNIFNDINGCRAFCRKNYSKSKAPWNSEGKKKLMEEMDVAFQTSKNGIA
mmetsp:Transcript_16921/g.23948  ORF Transcript_16921/g.23948 Transcript_16921/m.23948 type:complete len:176 (+) Transcript_16921:817-1344(+)